ncbi:MULTISPECIES: KamA family radical SAM protein [unclassified Pseudomonas]|uniref:KamA family radical SAM protein n=1 Tax=Pseudomonas TaxID=286 RepID=UPI0010130665|nr:MULTISPECIES: lysine 2,3-aminomutase [unclassified Pseudomonas]KAA0977249.1 lysine 2,3-aminomutase [Pseudomonas sp. ANT_J28]
MLNLIQAAVENEPKKLRFYNASHLDALTKRAGLSDQDRILVRAVAAVLPFRVNDYVIDELIDWSAAPDDPIYRLVFPQPDMLPFEDIKPIVELLTRGAPTSEIQKAASNVRKKLNPHPGGQLDLNVPLLNGERFDGIQHKYPETVLFFPSQGQTCHSYCTYCFRWAQFVQEPDYKISSREIESLCEYLRQHREVTSVLITGGDPMVMSAEKLSKYIDPIINDPELSHIESIRIGTKVLSYWPYKFLTDSDADEMLELFERVVNSGRNLAFMAHFTHPRELETKAVEQAIQRVLATGATIRTQSPIIRAVNDSADVWTSMWRKQVRLGMLPYYMFIERDTGPRSYFEVPLVRAYEIFTEAYRNVSGLCRTVRGPVMSATPGKVAFDGLMEINGEQYMALRFLQCRDPSYVNRPFLAQYDADACWVDDLKPALLDMGASPWSQMHTKSRRDFEFEQIGNSGND